MRGESSGKSLSHDIGGDGCALCFEGCILRLERWEGEGEEADCGLERGVRLTVERGESASKWLLNDKDRLPLAGEVMEVGEHTALARREGEHDESRLLLLLLLRLVSDAGDAPGCENCAAS